jgi:hypothetical protein
MAGHMSWDGTIGAHRSFSIMPNRPLLSLACGQGVRRKLDSLMVTALGYVRYQSPVMAALGRVVARES